MKDGKVSIRITNVLIQGEAGVGKTSTLSLLLEESPPTTRHSTSLATHPHQRIVHYCDNMQDDLAETSMHSRSTSDDDSPHAAKCVKQVTGPHKVQLQEGKWTNVELKKMITEMISIFKATQKAQMETKGKKIPRPNKHLKKGKNKKDNPLLTSQNTPKRGKSKWNKSKIKSDMISKGIKPLPIFLVEKKSDPSHQKVVTDVQDKIVSGMLPSTDRNAAEVLRSHWIYIIDSGGQPHFHNLLPHFVHDLSVALFVVCLSEPLDEHRLIEYYEDGKPISTPFNSHYTTEENLKFLSRSIQSHTLEGVKPKLILVGTFLDKLKDNPREKLSEINQKLCDILQPECTEQLIFNDSTFNNLVFPLNAQNPGLSEQRVAQLLRNEIQKAPFQEIDVPIRWHALEMALKELSNQNKRLVLSMRECIDVAQMLNIHKNALVESLKYFHQHHVFHYYHDILPDIVFTSTQVLLDKLTELVKKAYRMRDVAISSHSFDPKGGNWQKFKDQGIVTLEFLEDECFSEHYVKDIFSPSDLLKIFDKHLILTPFTRELTKINFDSRDAQYFMPSLLNMLPLNEVEKHRVINDVVSPLLIRFKNGWPRAGVFCCLQVFLIQQLGWKIVQAKRKPKLVAQNCVMLSPPQSTALVTLIDSFAYIEVHVKSPVISKKTCCLIRKNIMLGIGESCKTLCYKTEKLELSFFCPCAVTNTSSSSSLSDNVNLHRGEYLENDCFIKCTIDESKSTSIKEGTEYTMWLGEVSFKLYFNCDLMYLYREQ